MTFLKTGRKQTAVAIAIRNEICSIFTERFTVDDGITELRMSCLIKS